MRYLALLMLGWLSLPAYALTQVDIYSTEIVIDAEQEKAEEMARRQGMKDVILRATGESSSLNSEVVRKALTASSRYISQLGYGQRDEQATLKMVYNEKQIRALLSQAQLPYWPTNRENLLVWLVEEKNIDREIAWDHSDSAIVTQLKQAASAHGIPLTIPVGDFDDITGVTTSDIWGGFIEPITAASQRYPVDGLLLIRVQGETLRWSLYDQSPDSLSASPKLPQSGVENGATSASDLIANLVNFYSKKNAIVFSTQSTESAIVKILNVNNAIDFFTLEKRINELNSVASVDIERIQANEVTIRVHLLAPLSVFETEVTENARISLFIDPFTSQPEEVTSDESNASDANTTPEGVSVSHPEPQLETAAVDVKSTEPEVLPTLAELRQASLEKPNQPQALVTTDNKPEPKTMVIPLESNLKYDLVLEWMSQ